MKLELDVKNNNSEISRLRVLVDRLRADNANNNKEFLRLAELPHKLDPLKVQKLVASIKLKKDTNAKHKLFYKWRQRLKIDNLRTENRCTIKFTNLKVFTITISDIYYNIFMKSFPKFSKNETNSFLLFKNHMEEIKPSIGFFLTPFKAFYME